MEGSELSKQERDIFEILNCFHSLRTLYSLDPKKKAEYKRLIVTVLDSIEEYISPENSDIQLIIQIYNIL